MQSFLQTQRFSKMFHKKTEVSETSIDKGAFKSFLKSKELFQAFKTEQFSQILCKQTNFRDFKIHGAF